MKQWKILDSTLDVLIGYIYKCRGNCFLLIIDDVWCIVLERKYIVLALLVAAALVLMYILATLRPQREPDGWLFTVDVNGEKFKVLVTNPETAKLLREMMRGERQGIIVGELRRGDGGFNKPWSWHLDPETIEIAEITIELCDGTPSFIESELDYWLNTVKRYCPWGGVVVAEEPWYRGS